MDDLKAFLRKMVFYVELRESFTTLPLMVKNDVIREVRFILLDWKLTLPILTFDNIHNMIYGFVGNCCNIERYDV